MYGVLATQAGPNWCWTELNYFNFIHTESSSVLTVLFSSLLHNDRQNPNPIQMKVWGSQGWTPSKQTKTVRHFYFKSTAVVYQQGLYSLMLSYLRCYLLQFLMLLWKKKKPFLRANCFTALKSLCPRVNLCICFQNSQFFRVEAMQVSWYTLLVHQSSKTNEK